MMANDDEVRADNGLYCLLHFFVHFLLDSVCVLMYGYTYHNKRQVPMARPRQFQMKDTSLMRISVELTLGQHASLATLANALKVPKAWLIREGVDLVIKKYQEK